MLASLKALFNKLQDEVTVIYVFVFVLELVPICKEELYLCGDTCATGGSKCTVLTVCGCTKWFGSVWLLVCVNFKDLRFYRRNLYGMGIVSVLTIQKKIYIN